MPRVERIREPEPLRDYEQVARQTIPDTGHRCQRCNKKLFVGVLGAGSKIEIPCVRCKKKNMIFE